MHIKLVDRTQEYGRLVRTLHIMRWYAYPEERRRILRQLNKGEALLTLEAMKMETTVRAERDGVIKEILARPGLQVDTKDLLIVFDGPADVRTGIT